MTDQDITTLALGSDLTTLGLSLNSPEYVVDFFYEVLLYFLMLGVTMCRDSQPRLLLLSFILFLYLFSIIIFA